VQQLRVVLRAVTRRLLLRRGACVQPSSHLAVDPLQQQASPASATGTHLNVNHPCRSFVRRSIRVTPLTTNERQNRLSFTKMKASPTMRGIAMRGGRLTGRAADREALCRAVKPSANVALGLGHAAWYGIARLDGDGIDQLPRVQRSGF
jgi:hypothetical protein